MRSLVIGHKYEKPGKHALAPAGHAPARSRELRTAPACAGGQSQQRGRAGGHLRNPDLGSGRRAGPSATV
jgi:hypothetical protein